MGWSLLGRGAGEQGGEGAVSAAPALTLPGPCLTTSIALPSQEYLSGSLAALHSNQIITLKVCRFSSGRPLAPLC